MMINSARTVGSQYKSPGAALLRFFYPCATGLHNPHLAPIIMPVATLDEFESRLQSLLEGHLLKHLPGYRAEDGIAQQLAVALHGHLRKKAGLTQAPNPRLLKELANALYVAGKEAGFLFSLKPTVTTTVDPNLSTNDLRIVASFSEESVAETQGISLGTRLDPASGRVPSNAFLIIGGSRIIPLNHSVINIGRRLDNHVVLDDPRVSRTHAQLRIVKDHFVLFDLNSSGGTFVNGQRAIQSVLYPGDVISLAGVSLIFGQDSPREHALDDGLTEPGVPISTTGSDGTTRKEDDLTK
jgi:hypothetical protein